MQDVRWIAKVYTGDYFIDIIFNAVNNICRVDDTRLERAANEFVQETAEETLHLDPALSRLDTEQRDIKKIAVLHYAPIKETVVGEPEAISPFLGGSRFAEPLNRHKVLAAFHGLAHIGTLEGKTTDGVPVYNVTKRILLQHGFEHPFYLLEI